MHGLSWKRCDLEGIKCASLSALMLPSLKCKWPLHWYNPIPVLSLDFRCVIFNSLCPYVRNRQNPFLPKKIWNRNASSFEHMIWLYSGLSQMPLRPEMSTASLNKVKAYFLSKYVYRLHYHVVISETWTSTIWGLAIMDVQLRLVFLPFKHWNCFSFFAINSKTTCLFKSSSSVAFLLWSVKAMRWGGT